MLRVKATLGDDAAVAALTAAADLPPGDARMEFVGDQQGAVTFFGGQGRQYRGGNNPHDRYANVHAQDVERLLMTGKWRLVVRAAPTPPPTPIEEIMAPQVTPEPVHELVMAGIDETPEEAAAVEAANAAGRALDAKRRRGSARA